MLLAYYCNLEMCSYTYFFLFGTSLDGNSTVLEEPTSTLNEIIVAYTVHAVMNSLWK
jgi:hypothetical protein